MVDHKYGNLQNPIIIYNEYYIKSISRSTIPSQHATKDFIQKYNPIKIHLSSIRLGKLLENSIPST